MQATSVDSPALSRPVDNQEEVCPTVKVIKTTKVLLDGKPISLWREHFKCKVINIDSPASSQAVNKEERVCPTGQTRSSIELLFDLEVI
ncbi:UDP-glucose:undecaprenyl-phosphate glucose-1-phosphate transferase [Frankliniella fusca]|uniref:UDP-glucose:undecaprenyl-phosphate glucose-1-phosphate transferase n=1 Tax=Frankliniella fusca TaxID=407009 RepID=A0AAE1HLW3_9NEOP|nr:UDP-glucose:undecaprenyl-phosphate glucose-1-phosphate transferase [Frankliniella fusca]